MTETRPIPHDPAAEAAVLGACLLDERAFDVAAEVVSESDFFAHANRLTWRAISSVVASGATPDTVSVFHALRAAGAADDAGGLQRLSELAPSAPSASGVRRYSQLVADCSRRRRIVAAGDKLAATALDVGRATDDVLAEAARELDAIGDASLGQQDDAVLRCAVAEAVEFADARARGEGRDLGLLTGLKDLDRLLIGIEPGQLVVVAGRPGMGKSGLAVHLAGTTLKSGRSVYFWSGEMPRREVGLRFLSAGAGVPVAQLRSGKADEAAWRRIVEAREAAAGQRLFVDDRTAVSVAQLRATVRRLQRKHGVDLVVVDYLGLMRGPEGESRVQQLGAISRGLKALAIELDMPVLAAAQLNRANESRTDRRPLLSDLRDSGEIEQDADLVLMLHRQSYYAPDALEWKGVAEILVRKHRNGPTGDVLVGFQEELGRFVNHSSPDPRAVGSPAPRRTRGFDDAPRRPASKPFAEVD
jgi:replicative DNA helicase